MVPSPRGLCPAIQALISGFPLPKQKQKGGLVMVNFYNDYVSCQKEANLSQVAGGYVHSSLS